VTPPRVPLHRATSSSAGRERERLRWAASSSAADAQLPHGRRSLLRPAMLVPSCFLRGGVKGREKVGPMNDKLISKTVQRNSTLREIPISCAVSLFWNREMKHCIETGLISSYTTISDYINECRLVWWYKS